MFFLINKIETFCQARDNDLIELSFTQYYTLCNSKFQAKLKKKKNKNTKFKFYFVLFCFLQLS
jgi:hypothetical protein